jgi:membrane protease YdiL (CAAX protease family)
MLSQKPWRAEFVIQLIAGIMSCFCLGIVAVFILRAAGVPGFLTPDSFGSVLVATMSFQGAAWLLIYIFLKVHGLHWLDAFGFRSPRVFRSLLMAVLVMLVTVPAVLQLQQLSFFALGKLGYHPEEQRAVNLLADAHSVWLRWYLSFFAVVLAPVAEEFIFRGLLFPFIKQRGFPKLAWFGVSLLFAAIHVNAPTFVPLFVLALVLTWIYDQTDCLLASIAAHSLFNGFNLAVFFLQTR